MHHIFRVISQFALLAWLLITAVTIWAIIPSEATVEEVTTTDAGDVFNNLLAQVTPIYWWCASLGTLIGSAFFHIAAEITLLRKTMER
jgi:hypothetical protein